MFHTFLAGPGPRHCHCQVSSYSELTTPHCLPMSQLFATKYVLQTKFCGCQVFRRGSANILNLKIISFCVDEAESKEFIRNSSKDK